MSKPFKVVKRFGYHIIIDPTPGGSKGRLINAFKDGPNKILYIGKGFGFGILAILYITRKLKKSLTLVVDKLSPLTSQAKEEGAKVILAKKFNPLKYPKSEYHITQGLEDSWLIPYFIKAVQPLLPKFKKVWVPDQTILKALPGAKPIKSSAFNPILDNPYIPFWQGVFQKAKKGDWVWDLGSNILDVQGGAPSDSLDTIYNHGMLLASFEKLFPMPEAWSFIDCVMMLHIYYDKSFFERDLVLAGYKDAVVHRDSKNLKVSLDDVDRVLALKVGQEKAPPLLIKGTNFSFGKLERTIKPLSIDTLTKLGWDLEGIAKSTVRYIYSGIRYYILNTHFYQKLIKEGFTHECLTSPQVSYLYLNGLKLHPFLPDDQCEEVFTKASLVGKRCYINTLGVITIQKDVLNRCVEAIKEAIKQDKPTTLLTVLVKDLEDIPVKPFITSKRVNLPIWLNIGTQEYFSGNDPITLVMFNYKNETDLEGIAESVYVPGQKVHHDRSLDLDYVVYHKAIELYDFILRNTWVKSLQIQDAIRPVFHSLYKSNPRVFDHIEPTLLEDLLRRLGEIGVNLGDIETNLIKSMFIDFHEYPITTRVTYPGGERFIIGNQNLLIGNIIKVTQSNINSVARCALKYATLFKTHLNVPKEFFDHYSKSIKVEGGATPFNNHASRFEGLGYNSLFESDKELGSLGPFHPTQDTFLYVDEVDFDLLDKLKSCKVGVYLCTQSKLDNPFIMELMGCEGVKGYHYYSNGWLVYFNMVVKTPLLMVHLNKEHPFPEWTWD